MYKILIYLQQHITMGYDTSDLIGEFKLSKIPLQNEYVKISDQKALLIVEKVIHTPNHKHDAELIVSAEQHDQW